MLLLLRHQEKIVMYEHSMQWNVVSWRIAHVASRISKVNYTLDLHMSECYNTGRC